MGVLCIIDCSEYATISAVNIRQKEKERGEDVMCFCLSQSWRNTRLRCALRGYKPSTVTSVDAVSRCSPYCVLKLYLARNKKKRENETAEKVGGWWATWFQMSSWMVSIPLFYYQNTNRFLDVRKRKIDAELFFFVCCLFVFSILGGQQWWWGRKGVGGEGGGGGGVKGAAIMD